MKNPTLEGWQGWGPQPGSRQQFVLAPHSMAKFAFKLQLRATANEGMDLIRIPLVGLPGTHTA